ncbi:hypothetical protein RCL1_004456 [Eukaryota sp. TZLM3-RCL]
MFHQRSMRSLPNFLSSLSSSSRTLTPTKSASKTLLSCKSSASITSTSSLDKSSSSDHLRRTHSTATIRHPPRDTDSPTESINDYRILRIIGSGAFSTVMLGLKLDTNEYVAIKRMDKSRLITMRQINHVKSEKAVLKLLNHPFSVTYVTCFQDKQYLYLVMDFINGGELFYYLRKIGRFSLETSVFYAAQVVLLLSNLHSCNIIYRDIKPENLLLDAQGYLRVCDFGFAKICEASSITHTICGTPEYLSPEIIRHKGHSKATDFWSLGVFIFEMLAGYAPFEGDTPFQVYERIVSGVITFPSHFDAVTKDLIRRLLTPEPSRRLGNLRGGITDIMNHRFFRSINWKMLLEKQYTPPIIPNVKGPDDCSKFDVYEEEPVASTLTEEQQQLFADF